MKNYFKFAAVLLSVSLLAGSFSGAEVFAGEADASAEGPAVFSGSTDGRGEPGVIDTAGDLAALLPTGRIYRTCLIRHLIPNMPCIRAAISTTR